MSINIALLVHFGPHRRQARDISPFEQLEAQDQPKGNGGELESLYWRNVGFRVFNANICFVLIQHSLLQNHSVA
jgi:hypothetical protein